MIARIYDVAGAVAYSTLMGLDGVPMMVVAAIGHVNSGGWSAPELAPWSYIDVAPGGIVDFDFLMNAPVPGTIVSDGFVEVGATILLPIPDWVKGVRIHASTNDKVAMLNANPAADIRPQGGLPLPWPFPWFKPQAPRKS